MKKLTFTVDSALFRELGERLVGRPHIALAELIKNSYDADATEAVIRVHDDRIEVLDNGHGMTFSEFKNYWMRVGSPHKQEKRVSRHFGRRMTGSKGVGRLSAQFLGKEIEIKTVSDRTPNSELHAYVDWTEAVHAGELTEATALYEEIKPTADFPDNSDHGTAIVISALNQSWSTEDLVNLAREIWWLQPPFGRSPSEFEAKGKAFRVRLEGPDPEAVQEFESQMEAYHDIWHARLTGKVEAVNEDTANDIDTNRSVNLTLEFDDGDRTTQRYPAPEHCPRLVSFEIRIYHLKHRQPRGIRVQKARNYFNEHGGVHVYDGGFHLPYYGPENDWLNIEITHSHRREKSQLLPEDLQVSGGLTKLPTQSRILGMVHVNTAREQELAEKDGRAETGDYLKIQVTRDRLVDNEAYQALRRVVRWALDYYAMQETKRALEEAEAERDVEPVHQKFERVEDVLETYEDAIPEDVFDRLRTQVQDAIEASESEAEARAQQVSLMGSLATAGMSALAFEHEIHKQFQDLKEIASNLRRFDPDSEEAAKRRLHSYSDKLEQWVERANANRKLFSFLLDEENRETKKRFRARAVFDQVCQQMAFFLRGIEVTNEISADLRLPPGTFAEWSAISQNVILNAVNAMLDSDERVLNFTSQSEGRDRSILIQDTGEGVDLSSAEELFEPFERRQEISPERRELGYGGSGLGLTIVRLIAERLDCIVEFVRPSPSFSTAFRILWREEE